VMMKIPPLPCFHHTSLVHKSTSQEQRRRNRRGEEESRTRQGRSVTEMTEGRGHREEGKRRAGSETRWTEIGQKRWAGQRAEERREGPEEVGPGQKRREARFQKKKGFFLFPEFALALSIYNKQKALLPRFNKTKEGLLSSSFALTSSLHKEGSFYGGFSYGAWPFLSHPYGTWPFLSHVIVCCAVYVTRKRRILRLSLD
jgi:hypothetical protein